MGSVNGTKRAVACSIICFRTCKSTDKLAQRQRYVRQWFAFRVKSRFEKAVASSARGKGFEVLVPVYRTRRRWSDRSKSLDLPLFPGYVFCRLRAEHRFPLLTIPGVVHMVGIGKIPVPIDDAEISALQTAIRSELQVEPWPFIEVGQRVRLESGPLGGLEGFLVNALERHRVVVSLSALQRSVAVEIDHHWLAPPSVSGQERYIR
jgi:transcription antitermination factor NusG